jgi:hypothetical protein
LILSTCDLTEVRPFSSPPAALSPVLGVRQTRPAIASWKLTLLVVDLRLTGPDNEAMDGLGGAATVISILQTAWLVIGYIKAVRAADDDRGKILIELIRARALLFSLNDVAVETRDDEWARALQGLNSPEGVLASFNALLEELMDKLGVQEGPKRLSTGQTPHISIPSSQPSKRRDYHCIPFLEHGFRFGRHVSPRPANGLPPASEPSTSNGIQVLLGDMKWPFTQPEVLEYLKTLERIKTDLILALSSDNIRLSKLMHDRLQVVAGEVHAMTDDMTVVRQHLSGSGEWSEQRKRVFETIASVDFSSNTYPGEADKLKQGAIEFLHHAAFVGWLTSNTGITSLLLSGPPGIGKTSICKVVESYVQTMTPKSSIFVVAIYPTFARVQTLQTVLAYIVDKLLKTRPQVQKYYNKLMLTGEGELEISDCLRIIHRARQDFQDFYVLIDALDEFESDNARQIVERLTQLRTPIKVFATSRAFPSLIQPFENHIRAQDVFNNGLRDIILNELRKKVSSNDEAQLDLLRACSQEIAEHSYGLFVLLI